MIFLGEGEHTRMSTSPGHWHRPMKSRLHRVYLTWVFAISLFRLGPSPQIQVSGSDTTGHTCGSAASADAGTGTRTMTARTGVNTSIPEPWKIISQQGLCQSIDPQCFQRPEQSTGVVLHAPAGYSLPIVVDLNATRRRQSATRCDATRRISRLDQPTTGRSYPPCLSHPKCFRIVRTTER